VVLESLEGSEGSTTGEQLVAEAALVFWLTIVVVDLVVGVLSVTWRKDDQRLLSI